MAKKNLKEKAKRAIEKAKKVVKIVKLAAEKAEQFLNALTLLRANKTHEEYDHPTAPGQVVARRKRKTGELEITPGFEHLFNRYDEKGKIVK
jgi:hypothetical protein